MGGPREWHNGLELALWQHGLGLVDQKAPLVIDLGSGL